MASLVSIVVLVREVINPSDAYFNVLRIKLSSLVSALSFNRFSSSCILRLPLKECQRISLQ